MARWHSVDKADQKLYVLVGLVTVFGVVSTGTAALLVVRDAAGGTMPWGAALTIFMLVAVCSRLVVWIRIRSTRHGLSWTDAATLVGLAVLGPEWVVLAVAAGVLVTKAAARMPPVKLAFATAKEATTTSAGALVVVAMGGIPTDAPALMAALTAAFVTVATLDAVLSIPAIAWSARTDVWKRLRTNLDVQLATAGVRLAVALAAVLALRQQPALLYALPVLVLVAHLWHERWVRAREERQAWNRLTEVTGGFTDVDLDSVLRSAVTGGARLFSADSVEVEISTGTGRRLVRGTIQQVTCDDSPDRAPADGALVHAVPLSDHGPPGSGELRLRFRGSVRISEREQAMLASFALALGIALRTATAYGRLGEVTAAHAYAAAHDPLTGLANRREFERRLDLALSHPDPAVREVAVLILDLRHFKEVNDAFGHTVGDRLLTLLAERLAAATGPDDVLARFGGDEFIVALPQAGDGADTDERAARILACFDEPMTVDELPLLVEANAGLAPPVDASTTAAAGTNGHERAGKAEPATDGRADELVRRADVAMYRAKRSGERLATYTSVADPSDRLRLMLAGRLPQAVSQREFELHFQPIVDLASGTAVGAEALARWRHPTHGELPPRLFLDLLERSSQLAEFTAAMLDDALSACGIWHAAGHPMPVSVNISPRSLLDETLPRTVLDALRRHRTPPDQLMLELTESLPISQLNLADVVLNRLHDIGVRLALDDFGTGHSSLTALSRVPVHTLKIDRNFVRALREAPPIAGDLADDELPDLDSAIGGHPRADADPPEAVSAAHATAVVRSVVQLGHTLDLTVIAEGIENTRQQRLLWQLGCLHGQGYMFSRPVPIDRMLKLLNQTADHLPPGRLATPLHGGADVVRIPRSRHTGPTNSGTPSGPHR